MKVEKPKVIYQSGNQEGDFRVIADQYVDVDDTDTVVLHPIFFYEHISAFDSLNQPVWYSSDLTDLQRSLEFEELCEMFAAINEHRTKPVEPKTKKKK